MARTESVPSSMNLAPLDSTSPTKSPTKLSTVFSSDVHPAGDREPKAAAAAPHGLNGAAVDEYGAALVEVEDGTA